MGLRIGADIEIQNTDPRQKAVQRFGIPGRIDAVFHPADQFRISDDRNAHVPADMVSQTFRTRGIRVSNGEDQSIRIQHQHYSSILSFCASSGLPSAMKASVNIFKPE